MTGFVDPYRTSRSFCQISNLRTGKRMLSLEEGQASGRIDDAL